ncbi:RNA polymerase sigma factor SigJ [Gottfriedia sp. NPDC056225]|uniref:RNA polymerase sigma factor SigJ n=1 Tax=Gottfriedia sp. NPDC056225 TaxID=3345751 RepID=UPI001558670D|nr:RNA polymerase sigma factor SigJ [Arthrobacter citreus]
MEVDDLYSQYKPLLFSIGYSMLGSIEDSEDLVQDTFLAVQKLNHSAKDEPNNMKAYLCKIMTNRCLDVLKSSKHKREVYIGPWLPEPIIQNLPEDLYRDPIEKMILDETITYGFLVLIEQLNPTERAVFVLREAFDFDFRTIANILNKTELNCRKIFSRLQRKIQIKDAAIKQNLNHELDIAKRFIEAAETGNLDMLISLLTEDIILITDAGGKTKAALRPINLQKNVVAFLTGIRKKITTPSKIQCVLVNNQIGLMVKAEGEEATVICFEIEDDRYRRIYMIRNPDKIRFLD